MTGRIVGMIMLIFINASSGCHPAKTKQQLANEEKEAEIEELRKIKELPQAQIRELLKSGTVFQRRAAFAAFAPQESPPAEPNHVFLAAMCDALRDPDDVVRVRAVRAIRSRIRLWQVPPDGVLPALCTAAKDAKPDVRAEALEALNKIGDTSKDTLDLILEAVKDTDSRVRMLAANSLGRYVKQAEIVIPTLKELLKDKESIVRTEAVWSLGQFGEKSLVLERELILALEDPGDRVRWQATVVIEQINLDADKVVPAILKALEKESVALNREWLARALKSYPSAHRDTIPILVSLLTKDYSADVRAACAETLGQLRNDPGRSIPALIEAAKDPSEMVRGNAFQSLGYYGMQANDAIPLVVAGLQNDNTKAHAGIAIRHFGAPAKAAVPQLIKMLDDEKDNNRQIAVLALGAIGPDARDAIPVLQDKKKEGLLNQFLVENALQKIDPRVHKK